MRYSGTKLSLLTILILLLSSSRPTFADTTTAMGDRSGEGSTPFTGVALSPDTNLFTGAATTSIPIDVPRGRKSMTPALSLVYSSTNGPSPFGFGWDLPIGRIERNTKFGIPRCSPVHDDFVLVMPGGATELQADPPPDSDDYRPRVQEAYTLARKFTTSGNNYWEVYDRSGMTFVFGDTGSSRAWTGSDVFMQTVGAQCHYTGVWALSKIKDANGNQIDITYGNVNNVLHPSTISYGGNPGQSLGELIPHLYKIKFTYVPRVGDLGFERYLGGIRSVLTQQLQMIEVQQLIGGTTTVRKYSFAYDQQGSGPGGYRTFLNSVSVLDGAGVPTYPTDTFVYTETMPEFVSQSFTPPGAIEDLREGDGDDDLTQTLLDMNGDGFVDIVRWVNDTLNWEVYRGGPNGFGSTALSWTRPPLFAPNHIQDRDVDDGSTDFFQDTFDITGDGVPDYVNTGLTNAALCPSAPHFLWRVYRGIPFDESGSGGGFSNSVTYWCSPRTNIREDETTDQNGNGETTTYTWQDIVDMNADGLPDLVDTRSTNWQVYLNTGTGFSFTALTFSAPVSSLREIFNDPIPVQQSLSLTKHLLADFNADGLPDLIRAPNPTPQWYDPVCGGSDTNRLVCLNVHPNTGQGFTAAPNQVPYPHHLDPRIGLTQSNTSEGVQYSYTQEDLFDVNGDGLPDLVNVEDNNQFRVALNIGGRFEAFILGGPQGIQPLPPQIWTGISGPIRRREQHPGDEHFGTRDVADFNGDGLLDVLDSHSGIPWTIYKSKAKTRPALLGSIQRLGGTTTLRYSPSTTCVSFFGGLVPCDHTGPDNIQDLPFVTWVVTGIRENDGQCTPPQPFMGDVFNPGQNPCIDSGNERITIFAHRHGFFDANAREFRGFGFVDRKTLDLNITQTEFWQDDERKGRRKKTTHFAFLEQYPVLIEQNDWQTTPIGSGRTKVWLAEIRKETRDLETLSTNYHLHLQKNLSVDAYGNVLVMETEGAGGTDRIRTEMEYAVPSGEGSGVIFDKPAHTRSLEGASVFAEQWFYYDGAVSQTDGLPAGQVTKGNVRMVKSKLGNVDAGYPRTRMTYDPYGNVTKVKDARGSEITTQYDAHALYPAMEANALGHAITTETNYAWGKPAKVIGPNGSATPGEHTSYTYDTAGRLQCVKRPGTTQACSTRYTYSYATAPTQMTQITVEQEEPNRAGGYLPTIEFLDALGRHRKSHVRRVVTGTEQMIVTGQVDYTKTGRLHKRYEDYVLTGSPPALTSLPAVVVSYQLNGGTSVDPLGRVYEITATNNTTQRTLYFGRRRTRINEENVETRELVDPYRRVLREEIWTGGGSFYSSRDFTYDGAGRLETVTLNDNIATRITNAYDELGRKTQMIDPDSGTWTYEYDLVGNLRIVDDPNANQHVQYCHDAMNRMTFRTPMSQAWTGTFVGCTADSANAAQVRYFYDQAVAPDPAVPNARGQLTKVTDGSGSSRFDRYDERGRLEQETKTIDDDVRATHGTTTYEYDTADRVTVVHYPDGERVRTSYDTTGQPVRLRSLSHGLDYVINVDYDRFGRWTTIQHGNGVDDIRTFHELPLPTDQRHQQLKSLTAGVISTPAYLELEYTTYTPRGFIGSIADHRDPTGVLSNKATFQYDKLGRLIDLTGTGTSVERPYMYDTYGNMTQKGLRTFSYNYNDAPHQPTHLNNNGGPNLGLVHDANGNRVLRVEGVHSYTYDPENRLTEVGTFFGATRFTYDYSGRRVIIRSSEEIRYYNELVETVDGSGADYQIKYYFIGGMRVASRRTDFIGWQAALDNPPIQFAATLISQPTLILLVRADVQVGLVIALTLLASGLALAPWRRKRVVGIAVRHGHVILVVFAFSLGTFPWPLLVRPVAAEDVCGSTPTPTATPLPTPTAPPAGTILRHYHHDHLGSTQVITDAIGSVVEQVRYQPYGEIRGHWNGGGGSLSSSDERYDFTTYENEPASGLQYAGARIYDPTLGTFLTHDPAAEFASPYTYTNWNPTNVTDPNGACVDFISCALLTLAVAGVVAAAVETGVRTGDVGAAFKAGLTAAAYSVIGYGVGGSIYAGLSAASVSTSSKIVLAAVSIASTGNAGYGVYQSSTAGAYGTAAVAAAGLLLAVYGLAEGATSGTFWQTSIGDTAGATYADANAAGVSEVQLAEKTIGYKPAQHGWKLLHAGRAYHWTLKTAEFLFGTSSGLLGYAGRILVTPFVAPIGVLYELHASFNPFSDQFPLDRQNPFNLIFDTAGDLVANTYGQAIALTPGLSPAAASTALQAVRYIPGPHSEIGFWRLSPPALGY